MPTENSAPHRATENDAERIAAAAKQHTADLKKLADADAKVEAVTAQLRRVERTLEALLSSKALSSAQRTELLGLLAGTRTGARRDQAANPAIEQRLLTQYRTMSRNDKHIVSMLFKRLAGRKKGGA